MSSIASIRENAAKIVSRMATIMYMIIGIKEKTQLLYPLMNVFRS
jgi:hypothetical protein